MGRPSAPNQWHWYQGQGANGATLNPDGARWWDSKGGNGGKKKPKFFYAHSLTSSSITNLKITNTPVQAVSINGVKGLTITDMTIDNSAGDKQGGHNTDGFDIGESSDVTITGAVVLNQDDCVAVNSGTVRPLDRQPHVLLWCIRRKIAEPLTLRSRASNLLVALVPVATVCRLAVLEAATTIPSITFLS